MVQFTSGKVHKSSRARPGRSRSAPRRRASSAATARSPDDGAHAREDFPDRDDQNWRRHTLARLDEAGKVTLSYRPVHADTTLPMSEGGIDPKRLAPKKRVY